MFLQTAEHKPRRSRSQTPPRRQHLFWLSAGKAAETKVKTSGRMAVARCGSAQLGAAPPALCPPPFSTGSSQLARGSGHCPTSPPWVTVCADLSVVRCQATSLPSTTLPPASHPLSSQTCSEQQKKSLFSPKKSHFPISPRCTQLPIPAPLPAVGRTWPGVFWRRPRLCFEHRATHAEQPLGAKPP